LYKYKFFLLTVLTAGIFGCAPLPVRVPEPSVTLYLSHVQIEPGHTLRVMACASRKMKMTINGFNQTLSLYPINEKEGCHEAFLAIPLETQASAYTLTLTAQAEDGALVKQYRELTVIPRPSFKTVHLWIRNFGKYDFASESAIMDASRRSVKHYFPTVGRLTRFLWPIKGRITEIFGVKRIYNHGRKSWYHGGIDIAAPAGTLIRAPAKGIVILVRHFEAHGKTTMINHGYGVVSTYLHQRNILVKEGQLVQAGEIIGEVGTTGSSTGNHLHFQINVNGIKADPRDFLEKNSQINRVVILTRDQNYSREDRVEKNLKKIR